MTLVGGTISLDSDTLDAGSLRLHTFSSSIVLLLGWFPMFVSGSVGADEL